MNQSAYFLLRQKDVLNEYLNDNFTSSTSFPEF